MSRGGLGLADRGDDQPITRSGRRRSGRLGTWQTVVIAVGVDELVVIVIGIVVGALQLLMRGRRRGP